MVWQPPGWEADGWQPLGWQPDNAALPPVFVGPIPDISAQVGSGPQVYELGAYFSGADSFAIAPAIEAGWSFNTGTGQLAITTDDVGAFGPFVITATNANGTADSNAFDVSVTEEAAVPLGNLGPRFFMPMSATIGRIRLKPKEEPPPDPEPDDEPPSVPTAAPARPPRAAPVLRQPLVRDSALYREIASSVAGLRATIAEASRRAAQQQEEQEALAVLMRILAEDDA